MTKLLYTAEYNWPLVRKELKLCGRNWAYVNLIFTRRLQICIGNAVQVSSWLQKTDGRHTGSVISSSQRAYVHVWLRVSFCLNPVLHSLTVPVESHVLHLLLFDVCHLKETSCLLSLCLQRESRCGWLKNAGKVFWHWYASKGLVKYSLYAVFLVSLSCHNLMLQLK